MTSPASDRPPLIQALADGMQALTQGRHGDACGHALRAVCIDPLSEEAWLLLAALAPPQTRRRYLDHLLKIHPESGSARQAIAELESNPTAPQNAGAGYPLPSPEEILAQTENPLPPLFHPPAAAEGGEPSRPANESKPEKTAPAARPAPTGNGRKGVFAGKGIRWAAALVSISCVLALSATAFAGAVTYAQEAPVVARVAREQSPIPPSFTPSSTPTITASFTPTYTPTFTPTATHTPTNTRPPTNTPWPDEYIISGASGERWIDVDISSQSVTAYQGSVPVRTFIVSTGTAAHPTVLGRYRIYIKLRYDLMTGPGYYLPNVPYVMYFYQGYSLHGTYWHHNFGTPMSHGCINMYTPDAEWMFNWASVGTLVNIHW